MAKHDARISPKANMRSAQERCDARVRMEMFFGTNGAGAASAPAAAGAAPAAAESEIETSVAAVPADANASGGAAASDEVPPDLTAQPQEGECPVCMETFTAADGTKPSKPWPASCGHMFCVECWDACIARDLRCPMCRTAAPRSARPVSRGERLLTAYQVIRLQELERLRRLREEEERQRQAREPRTRIGRWVKERQRALDRYIDSIMGLD